MEQAYLFNKGLNYQSYRFLGSHPLSSKPGEPGYRFAVWAPNARSVSVVGDFNGWNDTSDPMDKNQDTGIWYRTVPTAVDGQRYAYIICGADGQRVQKYDPMARHYETRPGNCPILYRAEGDYRWSDDDWMKKRKSPFDAQPLNIYEVHLGSWRRYADGNTYDYRKIAEELADYVLEMGYNAIELMPVTEYPLDDSWGYQVTGYFAPTSRYGLPSDFKFFIDHMHKKGIRVILDWVPAHFPKDHFALARFDGTPLYEYADARVGEHFTWGTLVFDYSKAEVLSFLTSSAWFWLEEFHLDGFRVDAVSSMIYLDYDRDDFVRNRNGGNENLEALDFLRHLNDLIVKAFPGVMMIAEESTAFPLVSHPTDEDGLGFTHKWNMGWMHDTLKYMSLDYIYRSYHHNQLSFSMTYAFSERYVLAFSHDEVVHGKKSLLEKMPGDEWRKYANYRAMMMYMMSHPGAKLSFMGNELSQIFEWDCKREIDWACLQDEYHRKAHHFIKELNHYYLDSPALWEQDDSWYGFEWMEADDRDNSVYIYSRAGAYDNQVVLVILNLTPAVIDGYVLRAPRYGRYRTILNSDDARFGGSAYWGCDEERTFVTQPVSGSEAEDRYRKLNETLEHKKSVIKMKRDKLEELRLELVSDYRELLSNPEYEQPEDCGHALRGLEVPVAELPDLLPQYAEPTLTIDLPPLCALYLELEPEVEA